MQVKKEDQASKPRKKKRGQKTKVRTMKNGQQQNDKSNSNTPTTTEMPTISRV